ncbi:MAG TPA: hypothetical protein VKW06_14825 [Candidatus Angelobacter sp.]|nr:hypothetical protein [Candidatus Angelobacter sp.]
MLINYQNTTNFSVWYDSTFTGGTQPDGPGLSQAVVDYCEYDLVRLSMLFGHILPAPASLPITINLVPGGGGGNNNGLNIINCNCNINTDPRSMPTIVVAELAEIFMALQAKGWIAGWSNGEALSRVCAGLLYPYRAWLFQTGQQWLNSARPDWVDTSEQTDQDSVSTGCGTLFLNYLANQLNLHWPDIIVAGAPATNGLAETAGLLGVANPWTNFSNLITANLPPGSSLPAEPTSFGQPPEPTDDPFPFGTVAQIPALYTRHNLADDGTSHTGSLSDSPDIIVKNNPVANPQATYSTPASINSDTESDPDVLTGQANYVYLRVWNRGADAANVFASVYWSPPATLVSPNLWNLIGSAYYPDVPPGQMVMVSNPGITWPADKIPVPGHYCFVSAVGNGAAPGPNPGSFATFNDFVNYIYTNNNITWRNFNVVTHPLLRRPPWGDFIPLRFLIAGAWDKPRPFVLETQADLPEGSRLALQVPYWIGEGLKPPPSRLEKFEDAETDPDHPQRSRIHLPPGARHQLGGIQLPAGTAAASHMLVHIPEEHQRKTHKVLIRQLFENREVGRITWLLKPSRRD